MERFNWYCALDAKQREEIVKIVNSKKDSLYDVNINKNEYFCCFWTDGDSDVQFTINSYKYCSQACNGIRALEISYYAMKEKIMEFLGMKEEKKELSKNEKMELFADKLDQLFKEFGCKVPIHSYRQDNPNSEILEIKIGSSGFIQNQCVLTKGSFKDKQKDMTK